MCSPPVLPGMLELPALGLLERLVVFAVSLLVGASAIHVASLYVYRDREKYLRLKYAVVTALLGALAWALLSWVPLLGAALALLGWVAVVRYRYPGGWTRAALTGVIAWALAVVVLAALSLVGLDGVSAFGVPGA